MSNQSNIKQLTFGVSFNNMFRLLDMWGEIADDILYKSKFFSPEFFPNISSQYTTERSLSNPKTGDQLIITASNLVFTQNINKNYDLEYGEFKKRVTSYIVPSILSAKGLVIRRLGMVYVNELNEDAIRKFASLYFNPSVQGISDFRFSKKETLDGSLLLASQNDFVNKIYSVGNLGNNLQGISYDYQRHFLPLRQDVRDTIEDFMAKANAEFSKDILSNLGDRK